MARRCDPLHRGKGNDSVRAQAGWVCVSSFGDGDEEWLGASAFAGNCDGEVKAHLAD